MVWPQGWVCHAVRAPGVKWTLDAVSREAADGVATASTYTAPVNHSVGPAAVSMLFLVILMPVLLIVSVAGEAPHAVTAHCAGVLLLALFVHRSLQQPAVAELTMP